MSHKYTGSDFFYLQPTNEYVVVLVTGSGEDDVKNVFKGSFEDCMEYMLREQAKYKRAHLVTDSGDKKWKKRK